MKIGKEKFNKDEKINNGSQKVGNSHLNLYHSELLPRLPAKITKCKEGRSRDPFRIIPPCALYGIYDW